ncbi:MAG: RIP metalloprotease RseP [Pseudomonadales bacterium]|nr:MAG: RIP metalloprotease RseP [Pseudomonadales bacterium]
MTQLTTIILTLLAMIFVLGPLVALHEWGHYIVARLCGVKVLTYSIGFGKKLWSWKSPKTGIEYQVAALPLGGFVQMLDGREGEIPKGEEHLAFDHQHPLKKIAIVVAGPLMNFIIAIVLFTVLFMTPSEQRNTRIGTVLPDSFSDVASLQAGDKITAIDDKKVQSWESISYLLADHMGETTAIKVSVTPYQDDTPQTGTKDYTVAVSQFMQGENKGQSVLASFGVLPWQPMIEPVVASLSKGGAAERMGLKVGDKIVKVNETEIDDWLAFQRIVKANPETTLAISVLRDGKPVSLDIMPQGRKDKMGNEYGIIGAGVHVENITIPDSYKTTIQYDLVPAVGKSFEKTYDLSVMTLKSMGKMLSGMIGLENLSGPITIAKVAKQSFEISWQMVLDTAAMISLSLAVLNLLPIPVLDGGHMMFYIVELIRGKPLSEKTQIIGFNIGFALMGCLMLLAIGLDINRLL